MLRGASLLLFLLCLALSGTATAAGSQAILVKLRAEGPHATLECLERLHRAGAASTPWTADGSDSLDRIHAKLGVRDIRSLIRRPDGTPFAEQRRSLGTRLRRSVRRPGPLPDLSHVYRIEFAEPASVDAAIALYQGDRHVVWAQRDHTHDLDDLPNDPFLSSSGSWGQAFEDLWGVHRIRAPEAWEITRGAGVIVAVVDTGLDYDHPDIAANVWLNAGEDLDGNGQVDASDFNGLDDDGNGFIDDIRGFDFASSIDGNEDGDFDDPEDLIDPDPFDDRGHGTHVAGTIGAVADNGIGIAGIAPEATIMPLMGFPKEGSGRDSDLWRAVLYAAENGARVINTSWSCNPMCPVNPLGEEIVRLVHEMDVVIVTSAGNRSSDVVSNSPEHMRETITVASTGQDDLRSASFSNFGWLVDVAAPGGGPSNDPAVRIGRRNILSLRSSGDLGTEFASVGEGYHRLSGTSMSTPHVAGVAALIRSAMPDLDAEGVRRRIRLGAEDLGTPGHDRLYGAGRLDAFESLTRRVPEMAAAIDGPRQGSVFRPSEETEIEIRGTAAGADFSEFQVSYGLGTSPATMIPIGPPSSRPVENGILAIWRTDGLEEGSYLVRLDATATDGTLFSEFLIASLERNQFRIVSSPGRPAEQPDVSGDLVVWQSEREAADPNTAAGDMNLFATSLRSGREFVIQGGPGHQESPSISGRNISWIDTRNDPALQEVYGCRLDRRRGVCSEFSVSDGFTTTLPPASAAGSIFWLDSRSGDLDIRACRPHRRGNGCEPYAPGLDPARRAFLETDGRSLVWAEPGNRTALCEVERKAGTCSATNVADPVLALSRATASDGLLAWVGFDFRGRRPLQICEVDRETGACAPLEVAIAVSDATPKLSGNRLVWDGNTGDQATDVFFCEYDRVLGSCPVQRITAHFAAQRASDIDRNQVVWQDLRSGPSEVWGIELPSLSKLHDRRIREGRLLRMRVGRGSRHGPNVELAAEAVGHESLESIGARFETRREGTGWLTWRPEPGQAGPYAFTFSGTTEDGLVTRQTIRVDVLERCRSGRSWRRITHRGPGAIRFEMPLHLGDHVLRKACSL